MYLYIPTLDTKSAKVKATYFATAFMSNVDQSQQNFYKWLTKGSGVFLYGKDQDDMGWGHTVLSKEVWE